MATAIGSLVGSVVLGGSSSISSSSASYSSGGGQFIQGETFVKMVEQTPYIDLLNVPTTYEVYIIKRFQLHRLLLVRMKHSDYPMITFEINTPNMTDLTTVMQIIPTDHWLMEKIDDYEGTLKRLCEVADDVASRMENYRLFTNNCQHFCNNLLQELGFQTYDTTVGPTVSITQSNDHIFQHGMDSALVTLLSNTSGVVRSSVATAIGMAVGAHLGAAYLRTQRNRSN